MLCLGIESTAHTFGVGIVSEKGDVLSNIKSVYRPREGWGIKPSEAAEHHRKFSTEVLERSLSEAGVNIKDIDLIAFSQGPGLPPCLVVGRDFAVELEKKLKKPLLGVNHCIAHIEIGKLFTKCKDPVTVYVSGGNTQILAYVSGRYRVFGETQDIGLGNALDKFGRALGMKFPSGPEIEKLAKHGRYVELPYVVKGMDLSFSGIVTEAIKQVKEKGKKLEDVCFSFQETCFAMLTEVTERALAHTNKNEVLLTGGVGANERLQEMLSVMCEERGAKFYNCPKEFAGDNGAMIAWTGILAWKSNRFSITNARIDILPRWRTDEVDVKWKN